MKNIFIISFCIFILPSSTNAQKEGIAYYTRKTNIALVDGGKNISSALRKGNANFNMMESSIKVVFNAYKNRYGLNTSNERRYGSLTETDFTEGYIQQDFEQRTMLKQKIDDASDDQYFYCSPLVEHTPFTNDIKLLKTEKYSIFNCNIYEDASNKRKYWTTRDLPRAAGCIGLNIDTNAAVVKWQDDMTSVELDTIIYTNIPDTFFNYQATHLSDAPRFAPTGEVGKIRINVDFPMFAAYDLKGKIWTNKELEGKKNLIILFDPKDDGHFDTAMAELIRLFQSRGYHVLLFTKVEKYRVEHLINIDENIPMIVNATEWVQSCLRTMNTSFYLVTDERGIIRYYSASEEEERKMEALARDYARKNKPKPTPQEIAKIYERFILEAMKSK
jgi:hypothetical protein